MFAGNPKSRVLQGGQGLVGGGSLWGSSCCLLGHFLSFLAPSAVS